MSRHSGLGRHATLSDSTGDPLDGLVNLFDIGIVLAVAFLIAGLSVTLGKTAQRASKPATTSQSTQTLPAPTGAAASGRHGQPVGTVYRLPNGQLILVKGEKHR